MTELTDDEKNAIRKALLSQQFQLLIGAEEWDLNEEEETLLWGVIDRLEQEINE